MAVGPVGAVVAIAATAGRWPAPSRRRRRPQQRYEADALVRLSCALDSPSPARGGPSMRTWLSLLMVLSVALAACASVLGLRREPPSHPFEHRAHVLKGINCVECHAGVSSAGETGRCTFPPTPICRRCHQKPHDERSVHAVPRRDRTCGRRRSSRARSFASSTRATWSPSRATACAATPRSTEARPEAVLPKMATCFGCHEHRDQWTLRDCDGCHVDLPAEGTPPDDHLVHDGDFIREHGVRAASARDLCASCHTERQCASCHGEGTVPALPVEAGPRDDVSLSGLHRAGFAARHADEARADPGLCTTCHTESSCIDCHTRENVAGDDGAQPAPARLGRTASTASQARIDPDVVRRLPRRRGRAALRRLPSRRRPGRQPARTRLRQQQGRAPRPAVPALPRGRSMTPGRATRALEPRRRGRDRWRAGVAALVHLLAARAAGSAARARSRGVGPVPHEPRARVSRRPGQGGVPRLPRLRARRVQEPRHGRLREVPRQGDGRRTSRRPGTRARPTA